MTAPQKQLEKLQQKKTKLDQKMADLLREMRADECCRVSDRIKSKRRAKMVWLTKQFVDVMNEIKKLICFDPEWSEYQRLKLKFKEYELGILDADRLSMTV